MARAAKSRGTEPISVSENLLVEETVNDGTIVLTFRGRLRGSEFSPLEPRIKGLTSRQHLSNVVVNLEGVSSLDSQTLSVLLSLHRYFTEEEIGFRLINVNGDVLRVFQVSNLVNVFEIGPPTDSQATLIRHQREALWRSHAFTTQLLAALGEAVLGLDSAGKVLFSNPAAERILCWEEADLLGKHLDDCISLEDAQGRPIHLGDWASPSSDQVNPPVRRIDARLTNRAGYRTEIEIVSTEVFQSGQRIGRVLGLRDLTPTKRAQEEITRLATAVEQSAEMMVVFDPDGSIQYVNPAFEKVTQYRRSEAVGQQFGFLDAPVSDPVYTELWETIRNGEVWAGRFTSQKKGGEFFQVEATISPVYDSLGNIQSFVAMERDITNQMVLEQQLRESQKMEAVAQLAGGVAHDFNNLLTSIMGNLGLARRKVGDDVRGLLDNAEKACLRGAALVQQMLLYSRESQSDPVPLDINLIVSEVVDLSREAIDRRIDVIWRPAAEELFVKADPVQMHQVLLNLVLNARDAIGEKRDGFEKGGLDSSDVETPLLIEVETSLTQVNAAKAAATMDAQPGTYVCMAVKDTGTGIDDHTMAHIFEPFFTTKEMGKGTGLGLATVYGIVRNHGGWIEVSSVWGEGSQFQIYLPAAMPRAVDSPSEADLSLDLKGVETILLIDDEVAILEVAQLHLESLGYQVLTALDGREAINIFEEKDSEIDLVLLDLSLPKVSGKEVLNRLRSINPDIPVLISTGYAAEDSVDQTETQVRAVIQKPYRANDLITEMRKALDSVKSLAEPGDQF